MSLKCSTCGKKVISEENFVQFNCPSCGKENIVRCHACKVLSRHYICKNCGFEGP
ncbi:MAG: zinc finger domain-containing protein [Candidatus Aenigmatarchaeota archaeon]|nr:DUF1610 domain-containing protein [Candidatus Aenigmarchaeota archaeon]